MNTKPVEWTVDFEWRRCIDGYRLKEAATGAVIENVSDRYERYRPLDIPALFVRFAKDTPASARGMLGFCNQFGVPKGFEIPLPYGDTFDPSDDPLIHRKRLAHLLSLGPEATSQSIVVSKLLGDQARMRHAFKAFEAGDSTVLMATYNEVAKSSARIELRQAGDGRLYWCPIPLDLIRAMWFQFAMHATSGTKLFRCQRCNEPFVVGAKTGRRSTATYCSNACKVAAFKERHR